MRLSRRGKSGLKSRTMLSKKLKMRRREERKRRRRLRKPGNWLRKEKLGKRKGNETRSRKSRLDIARIRLPNLPTLSLARRFWRR